MFWFGLIILLASIPLAAEKIGPNPVYGFVLPRVRKDNRLWYPVNRIAGRNGLVAGAMLMFLSFLGGIGIFGGGLLFLGMLLTLGIAFANTVLVAAKYAKNVDALGPRIDTRSTFDKHRQSDSAAAREKLLDKLKK